VFVAERGRAVVWDWERDAVEASVAWVRREYGQVWTPEPVDVPEPGAHGSPTA
jgi:ATP-dependent Clp protease adapter protein ClpS